MGTLIAVVTTAVVVGAVAFSLPDIKRYLKIRSM
jgi:hypothetical protein